MEEHEKIKKLIEQKSLELQKGEQSEKKQKELEKMNALLRLVTDSNKEFFAEIDIDTAVAILNDIGIEEKDTFDIYAKLVKEEVNSKYKLVDIELEGDER